MRLKQTIIVLLIIAIVLLAAVFDAVRNAYEDRMREHSQKESQP